jgi:hypothetical protein
MESDYRSVDDFVASYLAHVNSNPRSANGFTNGLQPAYQPSHGFPTQPQPCGHTQAGPQAMPKWEEAGAAHPNGEVDMRMQPPQHMQQFVPAADWQVQQEVLQQQQLQVLHLQQQQQQHHHHQQQQQLELWHQQQQLMTTGLQAAPDAIRAGQTESVAQQQQQQQPSASSNAGAKHRSSSRGSTRKGGSRQPKLEPQAMDTAAEVDASTLNNPDLFHSWSAGPVLAGTTSASGATAAAAMVATGAHRSLSASYATGFGGPQDLTGVLMMQQTQAVQQRAAAAQAAPAQTGLALAEADEPDMSHMTVMQVCVYAGSSECHVIKTPTRDHTHTSHCYAGCVL